MGIIKVDYGQVTGGSTEPFMDYQGSKIPIVKGTAYPIEHTVSYPFVFVGLFEKMSTVTLGGGYGFYGTMQGFKADGTVVSVTLTLNTPYDISEFEYIIWHNTAASGRTLTFN